MTGPHGDTNLLEHLTAKAREAEQTAALAELVASFPSPTDEQQRRWEALDRQVLALPDWQMHRAELRRQGETW